ncbi:hypothetical protein KP509_1Z276700 [Ceratopteris richardii]|nr:hypothetical protein KP509_1Z276700 [Ceratopteris richardii]
MQEARQARNFSPVAAFHVHSANEPAIMWADIVAAESLGHNQQKSDGSSLSESLKSHFLASSKWISKAKNGFKEKWRSRVKLCRKSEFWVRAQEGSADVVRQAIRRIAPDSGIKDIDVSAVSSTYLQIRNADSSDKDGLLSQINT